MSLRTMGFAAAMVLAALPAAAEENGRYQLERGEEGFVRLDTVTGDMTLCRETASGLSCDATRDDTSDLRRDRDRLRDEVRGLRRENERLRDELAQESALDENVEFAERRSCTDTLGLDHLTVGEATGLARRFENAILPRREPFEPRGCLAA